jgi:hypothetical protein
VAAAPILPEQELFDEAGYLRLYPAIGEAIAAGRQRSAWSHYLKHGKDEGRKPNDVDADFYLRAYPQAVEDIEAGCAADAASHYICFGRARGYRPNPAAADGDAALTPPLWTDLPHALDIVHGRHALGRLSDRQADLLTRWIRDGFVVLPQLDSIAVGAAALDLERGFTGACPDLRFSCGAVALGPVAWMPEINPYPAAALDFHYLSRPVRALMFAEQITEFLGLVFDSPALLAHSRSVLRDAAPRPHRDAGAYSLPHQFVTAWIALEESGEALEYFPGSHRLPVSADELAEPVRLLGDRGQANIRHPKLLHRAGTLAPGQTRRGLVAQYCPCFVAPRYMESLPAQLWPYERHAFSTQYYTALEPLD